MSKQTKKTALETLYGEFFHNMIRPLNQVRGNKDGEYANPEQIFLPWRQALASAFDTAFYDRRFDKDRGARLSQSEQYAEKAMRLAKAMLDAIDEVVDAVKTRKVKMATMTLEALENWRHKLPVLISSIEANAPILDEIAVVSYRFTPDGRVHLELPEEAAWRICAEMTEMVRTGRLGQNVVDMIMKVVIDFEKSKLLKQGIGDEFVMAAADPSYPMPNFEPKPRKASTKSSGTKSTKQPNGSLDVSMGDTDAGDALAKALAEKQKAKAAATPATKKSSAKKSADAESPTPAS
jgi:hypothetical protein